MERPVHEKIQMLASEGETNKRGELLLAHGTIDFHVAFEMPLGTTGQRLPTPEEWTDLRPKLFALLDWHLLTKPTLPASDVPPPSHSV